MQSQRTVVADRCDGARPACTSRTERRHPVVSPPAARRTSTARCVLNRGCPRLALTLVHARRSFDAEQGVLEAIQRAPAPRMIDGVPTAYLLPARRTRSFAKLRPRRRSRACASSAARRCLPAKAHRVAASAPAAPVLELWGMTELAGLGTTHWSTTTPGPCPDRSAVAHPPAHVRATDRRSRRTCLDDAPTGEPGELMARGPTRG